MLLSLLTSLVLGADPARFAYLSAAARVCADPQMQGPCFSLKPDAERKSGDLPSILAYVGEEGGVVALETAPLRYPEHCIRADPPLSPFGIRVYAARSDLLAVTARVVRGEADDGAAAVLEQGTPLLPSGRGRWIIHPAAQDGRDEPLDLRLPEDAIGSSYVAGERPSIDRELLAELAPDRRTERISKCVIYQAHTGSTTPRPELTGGIGGVIGARASTPAESGILGAIPSSASAIPLFDWRLSEGSPLTWAGGGEAGALAEAIYVTSGEGRRVGDQLCWTVPTGYPLSPGAPVPSVQVCDPAARDSSPGKGLTIGDPIILGALDKPLIDAVIKENLGAIRRCYQDALGASPGLSGKIVIKFVIAKSGYVSMAEVKTTTLGHPEVEHCIKELFRRFRFPEPRGGGIVIVSYPFLFSPG